MKLQNLTVIFIIIIIPVILLVSLYISTGLKTIKYQSLYDTGLLTATHDAIYAFELNTANNEFANNPEIKRSIIKSSIKMFERSLANTCGISAYNLEDIEEYIPAIVFGMYDGFYMYAPSVIYNENNQKEYKHNLKNYVYYSETLDDGIVIIYSLDNYVTVSGDFGNGYEVKEGYLAVGASEDGKEYQGTEIVTENIDGQENTDGIKYYKDAYKFTKWFNENIGNNVKDENNKKYLYIDSDNDPENEMSSFVQHKRGIIRNKIESVLNSSITAYSERTWGYNYKMPKLSEEDWQKVYSNISMMTFFQGKSIGLTRYNGYCVLNSTNSNEYVNSNLMYFVDETGTYHDIRCNQKGEELTGYKIGSFSKKKVEQKDENGDTKVDRNGNVLYKYEYKRNELACYYCVNGQIDTSESIEEYISDADEEIKTAYWTSLARERYNTTKLIQVEEKYKYTITFKDGENIIEEYKIEEGRTIEKPLDPTKEGYGFKGWFTQKEGGTEVPNDTIVTENLTLYAQWEKQKYKFDVNKKINGNKYNSNSDYREIFNHFTFDLYIDNQKIDLRGDYDYWKTDDDMLSYGTKIKLSNIKPKEGYYYKGATIKNHTDGSSYYISAGSEINGVTITGYIEIILEFSNEYTVMFNPNGGSVSTVRKTVQHNAKYGELPTVRREGYTFDGWYTSTNGGTRITSETIVERAENHTLYAHWTRRYYTMDLNQITNGTLDYWGGGGTADIYIDGEKIANDTEDYYIENSLAYGTRLEVRDIKAKPGYYYAGATLRTNTTSENISRGTTSIVVTIRDDISIDLKFNSN